MILGEHGWAASLNTTNQGRWAKTTSLGQVAIFFTACTACFPVLLLQQKLYGWLLAKGGGGDQGRTCIDHSGASQHLHDPQVLVVQLL